MKKIMVFAVLLILMAIGNGCGRNNNPVMELVSETETSVREESIPPEPEQTKTVNSQEMPRDCYIFICGAIQKEGVYQVDRGTRLYKVIELAGGFSEDADNNYVNQAREVQDGEQIRIPTVEEAKQLKEAGESFETEEKQRKEVLININNASKEGLCGIPGIGESRALKIIAYREEKGPFRTIDEIKKVDGIKEGMFQKMKDVITVNE